MTHVDKYKGSKLGVRLNKFKINWIKMRKNKENKIRLRTWNLKGTFVEGVLKYLKKGEERGET